MLNQLVIGALESCQTQTALDRRTPNALSCFSAARSAKLILDLDANQNERFVSYFH